MNRREALATLAALTALPLVNGCSDSQSTVRPAVNPDAEALAALDRVAENLLRLGPEGATSLGIDVGARAALRSQLTDRSAEGMRRLASQIRQDLDSLKALDTSHMTHVMRTSVEVVRSA